MSQTSLQPQTLTRPPWRQMAEAVIDANDKYNLSLYWLEMGRPEGNAEVTAALRERLLRALLRLEASARNEVEAMRAEEDGAEQSEVETVAEEPVIHDRPRSRPPAPAETLKAVEKIAQNYTRGSGH